MYIEHKHITDMADRIHHALCLIAKHVEHVDTRHRCISLGIDTLEMSYMITPTFGDESVSVIEDIICLIRESKSLANGLVILGVFSTENMNIFDHHTNIFVDALKTYSNRLSNDLFVKEGSIVSPLFDKNFFNDTFMSQTSDEKSITSQTKPPLIKDINNDIKNSIKDTKTQKSDVEIMSFKTTDIDESIRHEKDRKKADAIEKLNRRSAILSFIKKNKESRMKDIMNFIGDISEKTIQRELNDLIQDGLIKKEGDRRWSKYSIK